MKATQLPLLLLSLLPLPCAAQEPAQDRLLGLLEQSRTQKRAITLYLQGAQLNGVVTQVERDQAVLRGQDGSQSVVRIDRIDAAAGF